MKASLRVVSAARTVFDLESLPPWDVWETDSESEAQSLVEFAGRGCYQSWSKPNPGTSANSDYIRHIVESKHYSVLEHAGFTVAIDGVSRSLTHELVRHRHFSYSQLSQRFVKAKELGYIVPPLLEGDVDSENLLGEITDSIKRWYDYILESAERIVKERHPGADRTERLKMAREAARCVLPNMTDTFIVVTGNHRAWREFFEKRGRRGVDQEMRRLAVRIFEDVATKLAPDIYCDMRIAGSYIALTRDMGVLEDGDRVRIVLQNGAELWIDGRGYVETWTARGGKPARDHVWLVTADRDGGRSLGGDGNPPEVRDRWERKI